MPKRSALLIPRAVLERAKLAVKEQEPVQRRRPAAAPTRSEQARSARDKVVAALKRLHPMD